MQLEQSILANIAERKDLCNMINIIYNLTTPYVDLDEKVMKLSIGRVLLTWEALADKKISHLVSLQAKERMETLELIFEMIGSEIKEFNLCGEEVLDTCLEKAYLHFKSMDNSTQINPCRH